MAAVNRRIRQRKGSANLARVKGYTMAMAYEVQQHAMRAESEWAEAIRADERERIASAIEEYADDLEWDAVVATKGEVLAIRDMVQSEIHNCAAIARGGA